MTNQINARVKKYSNYRTVYVNGVKLETPYTICWTCPECKEESEAFISDDLHGYNIGGIKEFFVFCKKCRKEWSFDIQVDLNVKIVSKEK